MGMKPGMMMLMQRMSESQSRSEYGGGGRRMIGYERNEPNMRGGYGRPSGGMPWDGGYENRYEMNGGGYEGNYGGGYESPENRRRRSPRTGRFIRGSYDGGMDDDGEDERHGYSPHAHGGDSYGDIYAEGTIYAPGAMNRPRGGMQKQHGHHMREVDEETAMEWVEGMQNADGSKGPHYKIDQVEQWRSTNCMDCDKWEFFVAVNMMYSDYCKVAEKMNISKLDFYGHMAKAFLNDEDAGPHKLQKYMAEIAEK